MIVKFGKIPFYRFATMKGEFKSEFNVTFAEAERFAAGSVKLEDFINVFDFDSVDDIRFYIHSFIEIDFHYRDEVSATRNSY